MSLAVFNSGTTKGEALAGINANFALMSKSLPTWKWDAADSSDPDPGCFTTDHATATATQLIRLAHTDVAGNSGYANIYVLLGIDTIIYLGAQDGSGVAAFQITAVNDTEGALNLTVGCYVDLGNWLPNVPYSLSFAPNASNVKSTLSYTDGNVPKFATIDGLAVLADSGFSADSVVTSGSSLDATKLTGQVPSESLVGIAHTSDITIQTVLSQSALGGFTGTINGVVFQEGIAQGPE